MKSERDAFEPIRSSQKENFGGSTPAARVKKDAGEAVMKLLAPLPLTATAHQIAGRLDEIERDHTHLFLTPSEQDEHDHKEALLKMRAGNLFGIPAADVASFTPRQKLELVNSGGKTLPPDYVLRMKGVGK